MTKVKIVKKLTDKGWPIQNKKYPHAHEMADKAEKKADPKTYKKINKMEHKLGKHEIMSKATKKKGIVEIEKKFSKNRKVKKNLIVHEMKEHQVETKKWELTKKI